MKTRVKLIVLMMSLFVSTSFSQKKAKVYDARTASWEILTPAAAEFPRINGPKIYGARPGKQFIFRIPCQGMRPIQFTAVGLPSGLNLDEKTGIITGRTPSEKGTYKMTFTAKNSKGAITSDFKLVVGDKLGLTPPMGWNSWGGYMQLVTDDVMRRAADFVEKNGLADVGFQYISIDDCWMRIDPKYYDVRKDFFAKRAPGYPFEKVKGPARDECGRMIPNDFFPDMKAMTDYIHSKGLKAGIYSGPGAETCQYFISSYGYEATDATTFADWGFDLLKYDMCSYRATMKNLNDVVPENLKPITEITIWHPMAQFLAQQDRDIFYNLCQYGRQDPWKWAPAINIQSWRIGGDMNHDIYSYFSQSMRIVKDLREYSKPGQWNDPDFMYVGKIHTEKNLTAPPENIPLNSNQRYQYVSLFALIASPYFFSANIDEPDPFMVGLLGNADIANVNQDELGHVAELVREADKQVVLKKKLADGSIVIGFFNRNAESDQVMSLKMEEIGRAGAVKVRDLWRQKDLGEFKDEISVNVSPDGCAVLKIY